MAEIKITITKADEKLSSSISETPNGEIASSYKYTYMRQLITRLRVTKGLLLDKPMEEQEQIMRDVLITERNISHYIAEEYAKLDNDNIFTAAMEIAEDIEEILGY
jgi:hypothetical protein